MTDRASEIADFLHIAGWGDAKRTDLAGDASNRRYERLRSPSGEHAVLMDAPPSKGEDVRPFVKIAKFLCGVGLSAPEIFAEDTNHGLLLIEDFGDALYARVLEKSPDQEAPFYEAAIDVLVALHKHAPPPELAPYDPKTMANMAALAWRWYRRGCGLPYDAEVHTFEAKIEPILAKYAQTADVLIQRDYHAENLIWLPNRVDSARVGLLDFQDAMVGHRAYDLISLLQDARRDVPQELETEMCARFIATTGQNTSDFLASYAVLGAQRNLRILGVFARLSMHFGKPQYVDYIPRVWDYLIRDLSHTALLPVRDLILRDLPRPDAAVLRKLKDQCGTVPTL